MRCGPWGPALASGLFLSVFAANGAVAETTSMRFVAQPELLQAVDPTRATAAAQVAAPQQPAAVTPPTPSPAAAVTVADAVAVTKGPSRRAMPSSWPVTLSEVQERNKAMTSGTVDAWSPDEIKDARQRCAAILKQIPAVVIEEEPIKEGSCGDPAPVQLISIGRKPEVVFSPPAIVNCEMVQALHTWISTGLQPLARRHLGGPIIKIEKMSDYSCRNAYGRAKGRLSEHGRANALDISGFTTAKGDTAMLLADWGLTQRDIRRQIAAAKAKADAEQKKRLAEERKGQENARAALNKEPTPDGKAGVTRSASNETGALPPSALGMTSGAPAGGVARGSIIDGIPRVTVSLPGASADTSSAFDAPSRLGGPKPGDWTVKSVVTPAAARGAAVNEIRKQRFLKGAHTSACKVFGTVLGPEANNAHRNHLHVDLAQRSSGAFCQ